MLLESMIDHEYPLTTKMEVEAPTASTVVHLFRHDVGDNRTHPVGHRGYHSPCCLQLVDMSLEEMEMPGQHLPAPDAPDMVRHVCLRGSSLQRSMALLGVVTMLPTAMLVQVYVDRLGSDIQVVRRNSNSCRRIVLHGSDGSLRTFLLQGSQVGVPRSHVGYFRLSALVGRRQCQAHVDDCC